MDKPTDFPTKIRTLNRPYDEIEVDEPEWTDLDRLGLILDSNATTDSGRQKAAEKQLAGPGAGDTEKE